MSATLPAVRPRKVRVRRRNRPSHYFDPPPGGFDPIQRAALEELTRRRSRRNFGTFFRAHPPSSNYKYGIHTERLIEELNRTTKIVEAGGCRYLCVCVPPRHGKSDAVSRRYPAWHLIRNPDHEVMLSSYNHQLATDMSYEVRQLMYEVGREYGVTVQRKRESVDRWRLSGHAGCMYAVGIGGTVTGRGAHVLIADDYCKNREDADSLTMRDKVWFSFQSDMMTRLAPNHAVIIVANRWHSDDLIGRIQRRNDPASKDYDPDFPKFEVLNFPAWDSKRGWLFPERYTETWYKSLRAFMGSYSWSAQGLQEPKPRKGNMLRVDLVNWIDRKDLPLNLRPRRGWDLASSEKELVKDDPDWTSGTLAAFQKSTGRLYILDERAVQSTALMRNTLIRETAHADGREIKVRIESVAGYKDAYETIRDVLRGIVKVEKVTVSRDLVARATALEPLFEAGKVYAVRGDWNEQWKNEFRDFPSGDHDDKIASLLAAVYADIKEADRRVGAWGVNKNV